MRLRKNLTEEICLNLALGLREGICQHLALDGQIPYLEDVHQTLDAVPSKHPEQAAPSINQLKTPLQPQSAGQQALAVLAATAAAKEMVVSAGPSHNAWRFRMPHHT